MEARLKTGLFVQALILRCDRAAIGVTVVRRGDPDAGAVLLKSYGRDVGACVLAQARRADGTLGWMRATGVAPVGEAAADAYIARQRERDPDLWVVEIETAAVEPLLDDGIIA